MRIFLSMWIFDPPFGPGQCIKHLLLRTAATNEVPGYRYYSPHREDYYRDPFLVVVVFFSIGGRLALDAENVSSASR